MMTNTFVLALLTILMFSGAAAAQPPLEGRFRTGALSWTPTLTLRDAGVDSNVYDEPANPKRDTSAVFAPQVDGGIQLTAAIVRFSGGADFVYFHQYTAERSVNTRGSVRVDMRGWRVRPFGRASVLDSRERVNSEIDVRARRADRDVAAGLRIQLTPRGLIEVGGGTSQSTFRQGQFFHGVDLRQRLNRESVVGNIRFLYELTPLTRFLVDGSTSRERFTLSPAYDADNFRGSAGVEFEPEAILRGRATIGFHRLEPRGALGLGFEGLTAGVDLGYVLFQRTQFDVRFSRDASYSFQAQPYFLQTVYGGRIQHTLIERVDIFGQVSSEHMDYPGIPERLIPADALDVARYGGGIALRPAPRAVMTITYELAERKGRLAPERSFERRRVYTTITYGF
jgi:hypothetical protein